MAALTAGQELVNALIPQSSLFAMRDKNQLLSLLSLLSHHRKRVDRCVHFNAYRLSVGGDEITHSEFYQSVMFREETTVQKEVISSRSLEFPVYFPNSSSNCCRIHCSRSIGSTSINSPEGILMVPTYHTSQSLLSI